MCRHTAAAPEAFPGPVAPGARPSQEMGTFPVAAAPHMGPDCLACNSPQLSALIGAEGLLGEAETPDLTPPRCVT